MRIISTTDSERIANQIMDQSVRLLDKAVPLRPPWGVAARERFMRLSKARLAAAMQDETST